MKPSKITAVCLLGGLLFHTGVKAVGTDIKDSSYKVIIERNVFGLKPPVVEVTLPPPTNQPANEVKLAGITTIVSPKKVILQWKEPAQAPIPGRQPVAPGKEQSYIMVEGQREGNIEVIEINEKAGSVRIKNAGEPVLLTFETHGVRLPSTPALAPQPGAIPNPIGAVPTGVGGAVPGNVNASFNPGAPGYNYNRPGTGNPNPAAGGVNPASGGLTSVPPRPIRSSPYTPTPLPQLPQQQQPVSPEAQIILMEANRKQLMDQGDPTHSLIPPTELTEHLNPPQ